MDTQVKLQKSGFAQSVVQGDRAVLWHSLFGKPRITTPETLEFLNIFISPTSIDSLVNEYEIDDEILLSINSLCNDYYLIPEGFNERTFLAQSMSEREESIISGEKIDYLELIMSEACNFRCTYCIHFNNLETADRINNPTKFMKFETAKQIVDKFLETLSFHNKSTAEVNFGGGEPLLAWPVVKEVLEYCVSKYGQQFEFIFSINTNCSLITEDVAVVLRDYKVQVAASLDGLQEANDKVRLTKTGKGTFLNIMKGFNNFALVGYPLDGFAVTVNEHNFPYINESLIDWAFELNMVEVRIDIDVVDLVDVSIAEIVDRLMKIRRYTKSKGIEVPGFWCRPAENMNLDTLSDHVAFCGAVRGNSMCVSPSGNIYGCGYSNTQLGSLVQIESFTKREGNYHQFVRNHLTGAMEMCKGCMIEGQCGGGCNITLEFAHSTNTIDKIERMCDFYREMTRQIILEDLLHIDLSAELV